MDDLLDEALPSLPEPQARALEAALLRTEPAGVRVEQLAVSLAVLGVVRELAREVPLVLAVDDLHWLDRPSERVLAFTLRRLVREPVALVATVRGELELGWLGELERELPSDRLIRVGVGPLALGALDVLLCERLGLSLSRRQLTRVLERSGGNPLHALELGRLLLAGASLEPGEATPVSRTLAQLVADRVERVSEHTRELLLEVAALSRPSLELVLGRSREFEEARTAGLLQRDGDCLRFSHPLYGSAIYSGTSVTERRAVHQRLAARIAEPEDRALQLALSVEVADEGIAAELEQAARQAAHRGAPEAAVTLAEHARRLTPEAAPAAQARRGILIADACAAAGDGPRTRALLEELVSTLAPGPFRAEALWRLAEATPVDLAHSLRLLESALDQAGDDRLLRARIEHEAAIFCSNAGDGVGYECHAEAAVAQAEGAGDVELMADALSELAWARFFRGGGFHQELMARAMELAPDGRPFFNLTPRTKLGCLLMWMSRHAEARSVLEADLAATAERGDIGAESCVLFHLIELECCTGGFARADELAARCQELARQLTFSNIEAIFRYATALVDAYRGRVDSAGAEASAGSAAAAAMGDVRFESHNKYVLGFLAYSLGDNEQACAHLRPLPARLRASGIVEPGIVPALPLAAEALVAVGELGEAEALVSELEALGARLDRPLALATGARCRALLEAARGDLEAALAAIGRAYPAHDRLGDPFERARTTLVEGSILRRSRKRGAARDALANALSAFEELGTPLWAERAKKEFARLGLRPSPRQLTGTETKVAELAATGATNREIANRLFLSVKTVEANLSRVYRKLGVRSRTELAANMFGTLSVAAPGQRDSGATSRGRPSSTEPVAK
jgi:DNA-binding CsgD family transcriptional regulator